MDLVDGGLFAIDILCTFYFKKAKMHLKRAIKCVLCMGKMQFQYECAKKMV